MKSSDQYASDHLIGKIAVYVCYVGTGVIGIEMGNPYLGLLVGTGVWLFGVNGASYIVECVRGHEHQHHII